MLVCLVTVYALTDLFPLLVELQIQNDNSQLVIRGPARVVGFQKDDRAIRHPDDAAASRSLLRFH